MQLDPDVGCGGLCGETPCCVSIQPGGLELPCRAILVFTLEGLELRVFDSERRIVGYLERFECRLLSASTSACAKATALTMVEHACLLLT